jgi:hypothetical protein
MKSHFLKKGIVNIKLIIICVIFSFSSCNKDGTDNNETIINENYYVKYFINGNGAYGRFSNWSVTRPQGRYTNSGYQVRSWSQTYGPVNIGFECEVQIDDYISGAPTIEIHVSKNEELLVLKLSNTGDSASYTIDY